MGRARTEEQGRLCTKNRLGGIRILVRTQLRSPLYSGEPNAGAHAHGESSAADPTPVVAGPTALPYNTQQKMGQEPVGS